MTEELPLLTSKQMKAIIMNIKKSDYFFPEMEDPGSKNKALLLDFQKNPSVRQYYWIEKEEMDWNIIKPR